MILQSFDFNYFGCNKEWDAESYGSSICIIWKDHSTNF